MSLLRRVKHWRLAVEPWYGSSCYGVRWRQVLFEQISGEPTGARRDTGLAPRNRSDDAPAPPHRWAYNESAGWKHNVGSFGPVVTSWFAKR